MKALKCIIYSLIIIISIYVINIIFNNHEFSEVNARYDKVAAFTFDDGPSLYTKEIVNTLLIYDFKATFFELGNRMKYNQEIVKYLTQNGMEVGSHTYSHKNLALLGDEGIKEELNSTLIIFHEITDENITLTRTPYGKVNNKVKKLITTPIINWSIDTKDWLYQDEDYICDYILENIKDGDIILMHDTYYSSLETIKKVLPILKERGYKITTVSELAKIKGIKLKNGETYRNFN